MAYHKISAWSCKLSIIKRYALKERDIIKFGKQKIKVRELVHHDSNISVVDTNTLRMSKKIYEDLKLKAGQ